MKLGSDRCEFYITCFLGTDNSPSTAKAKGFDKDKPQTANYEEVTIW